MRSNDNNDDDDDGNDDYDQPSDELVIDDGITLDLTGVDSDANSNQTDDEAPIPNNYQDQKTKFTSIDKLATHDGIILDLTGVESDDDSNQINDGNPLPNNEQDEKSKFTSIASTSFQDDMDIHYHDYEKGNSYNENKGKSRKKLFVIGLIPILLALGSGALMGLVAAKASDAKQSHNGDITGINQDIENESSKNTSPPSLIGVQKEPSAAPSTADIVSVPATLLPNVEVTSHPTSTTSKPTVKESVSPTPLPSISPTPSPTSSPTMLPTMLPTTSSPTLSPTISTIPDGSLPARDLILWYSPPETKEQLEQSGNNSPQSLALQWIERHPQNSLITTNRQILQRFALATFYYSTTVGDKPWNSRDTYGAIRDDFWLYTDASECEWFGITCNDQKVVTRVELTGNNLHGSLPHELALLGDLEVVALAISNQNRFEPGLISGTIPSSWGGRLTNLVTLELYDNYLSGTVPESFAKFTKLKTLNLGGNSLTGQIPAFLGDLSNLETLSLNKNEFQGTFPSELGRLTNLSHLDISRNALNGNIPISIGLLKELVELDLSENSLQGNIPDELWTLTKLGWLSLHNNNIDGNIVGGSGGIGNLINVEGIELQENSLGGTIPGSIGNLSNLRLLDISQNSFIGGIPQQIASLESLAELYLQRNLLMGEVSVGVCNLMENEGLRKFWTDCNSNGVICSCCDRCF